MIANLSIFNSSSAANYSAAVWMLANSLAIPISNGVKRIILIQHAACQRL